MTRGSTRPVLRSAPMPGRDGTAARRLALGALLLVCGAGCARSDARWLADLDDPDPFVRAMGALALAEQAPQRGASFLPVLLETVDRTELALRPRAEAALRRIGPYVADELIEAIARDEFMTLERRRAALDALVAAGPAVAIPALERAAAHPDPRVRDVAAEVLSRGGGASPAPTTPPPPRRGP